jgi:hypothetical protein
MESSSNKNGIDISKRLLSVLLVGGLVLAACAKQPADDSETRRLEFDGLMGDRYTEILLVFGNVIRGDYMAGVYNTVGLNDPDEIGDTSPQAILDNINFEQVKKNHDALSTVKNGPRIWTIDHLGVSVGQERDFQGLKARWVMWFPIPDEIREGKDLSYAVMPALRDTDMTIWKGSRVYILDDPEGDSFVMKSASLIKDPDQKFEDLKNLGSRLKLPEGWKFRSKILDQELIFKTKDGKSFITQDDIGNTYDRVGGPYSNYKP